MKTIEKNALRIAELMGWNIFHDDTPHSVQLLVKENIYADYEETISDFSSYNGLMPIVFECNKSDIDYPISMNPYQVKAYPGDGMDIYGYNTEPEFIEAIQLACIKYLELKCQQRNIVDNIE